MTVRLYACPIDQLAPPIVPRAGFYPRIRAYTDKWRANVGSNLDGTPALPWVLAVGIALDWTAADADVEMRLIAEWPPAIQTFPEARQWLKDHTVADLSVAMRNRFQNVFDAIGANRSDFTLATTLWQVFRRLASAQLEADDNFSGGTFG